jgi:hypothetical protein
MSTPPPAIPVGMTATAAPVAAAAAIPPLHPRSALSVSPIPSPSVSPLDSTSGTQGAAAAAAVAARMLSAQQLDASSSASSSNKQPDATDELGPNALPQPQLQSAHSDSNDSELAALNNSEAAADEAP